MALLVLPGCQDLHGVLDRALHGLGDLGILFGAHDRGRAQGVELGLIQN